VLTLRTLEVNDGVIILKQVHLIYVREWLHTKLPQSLLQLLVVIDSSLVMRLLLPTLGALSTDSGLVTELSAELSTCVKNVLGDALCVVLLVSWVTLSTHFLSIRLKIWIKIKIFNNQF